MFSQHFFVFQTKQKSSAQNRGFNRIPHLSVVDQMLFCRHVLIPTERGQVLARRPQVVVHPEKNAIVHQIVSSGNVETDWT